MSYKHTSYSSTPSGAKSQYSCGIRADFVFDDQSDHSKISGKYIVLGGVNPFKLSTYRPFNKSFIQKIINTNPKFATSASVPLYVMGIVYNKSEAQLTVTGKAKLGKSIKEAVKDGMNGELYEEAGFVIDNYDDVCIFSAKFNGQTKTTGVVRVTNCKIPLSEPIHSGTDDYSQRVEIAVIGTAAEFKKILGLVVKRPRIESDISGVMFTRIDNFIAAYQ